METIGDIIWAEAEKQNVEAKALAECVGVSEKYIYRLLKKAEIPLERIRKFSILLKHNFFQDLAENPDLAKLTDEMEMEKKAMYQFWEIVPNLLREMNVEPILVSGRPLEMEDDIPLPEITLVPYGITFSSGGTMEEKANDELKAVLAFSSVRCGNGDVVSVATNRVYGSKMYDIAIKCRSKEEWEKILRFAIDLVLNDNPNMREVVKRYPFV